jgi:hypothetical protein
MTAGLPIPTDWEWVQLRVVAGMSPLRLGEAFSAELMDTWVCSLPPEEQIVRWKFVSPSGRTFTQDAQYVGDWHWRVSFSPTEAGP